MSKELTYQSLILKKQPLNEADEIVTLYTLEVGKVRALAKSTKFSKSKLQHALQTLFLVNISIAGSRGMPKIIGAEVKNSFSKIRSNLKAAQASFYALELTLKFTPDEAKNEQLFHLLVIFFSFLDLYEDNELALAWGLVKFKLEFLESLGLGLALPVHVPQVSRVGFSNSRGSFLFNQEAADLVPVSQEALQQFTLLQNVSFNQLIRQVTNSVLPGRPQELQHLLSGFIMYQLERDIKSESALEL